MVKFVSKYLHGDLEIICKEELFEEVEIISERLQTL
jgi:hypothetical protein